MAVMSTAHGTDYGTTNKTSCVLFVRVKDLRNINIVTGTFDLRWRYFVYFKSETLFTKFRDKGIRISGGEWNGSVDSESQNVSRWYESELGDLRNELAKIIPRPTVRNRISKLETTSEAELIYKSKSDHVWCFTEQVAATLSHRFDLQDFPFDAHELKLDYRLNKIPFRDAYTFCVEGSFTRSVRVVETSAHVDEESKLVTEKSEVYDTMEKIPWYRYRIEESEFKKHAQKKKLAALELDQMLSCGPEFDIGTPRVEAKELEGKPQALFTIAIIRRSEFHETIMIMESLIATVVFSLVIVKPTEFATRLATSITVLFTIISFSTSVNSNMPKLAYQTFLSWHACVCVIIVIAVILGATINRLVLSRPHLWIDSVVFGAIFVAWLIYHVWLRMQKMASKKLQEEYSPIFPQRTTTKSKAL